MLTLLTHPGWLQPAHLHFGPQWQPDTLT